MQSPASVAWNELSEEEESGGVPVMYDASCGCAKCSDIDLPRRLPKPLSENYILVTDMLGNRKGLPRRFRTLYPLDARLRVSVSAQPSMSQLEQVASHYAIAASQFYIVDLRQESHGFINEVPFSWYRCRNTINSKRSSIAAHESEEERLRSLTRQSHGSLELHEMRFKLLGSVFESDTMHIDPGWDASSEEKRVHKHGFQYLRLHIPDHQRPHDSTVDRLLTFLYSTLLSSDGAECWVHFHCRGGRGRSSLAAMLCDMLYYAEKGWSLAQFHDRGLSIGNSELMKLPECRNKSWKLDLFMRRRAFLEQFHRFSVCPKGFSLRAMWTTWLSTTCQGYHSETLLCD